ncbi:chemotaxis protein CheW [Cryobacterium sp. GrIS_2_6]|uniref:chemotaxis protein CheW n=1 Tax=Cryobacterium sp. GrIS_2_6 TaxID=3162785 RepID=UPI002E077911|nr:purine-binding chemotaxis protein CheW [Cryobacterium psychrotolerans]
MNQIQALLLAVGSDLFAVPIVRVSQVVTPPDLTRLVTAPPHVLGLFNLRGQIVPLLDTARLLQLPDAGPLAFAVILQTGHGPVGLSVTALPQRVALGTAIGPSDLPGTAGVYRVDKRVAVLLDPDVLLSAARTGRGTEIAIAGRIGG